jgi:hypothetical protein
MHIYDRSLIHGRHITITGNTPPTAIELAATDAFFTHAAAEASEFFAAPAALVTAQNMRSTM